MEEGRELSVTSKEMTDLKEISTEDVVMTRSAVLTAKGSFSHVKVLDWPLPAKCTSKQIKVAVEYCGINFADVYHVFGRLLDKPTPYVLGLECVGEITELGSEVKNFKVGERVACYKPDTGLLSHMVIVDETECHQIPEEICSETACAVIANYLTAYFAVIKFGNLSPGQSILIHSAAGGVGWAATQLASKVVTDVTVFGTSSSDKHNDIISNGVTKPLTYDNFVNQIPKNGVNVVIDNIGGANSVVHEDNVKVDEAMKALASASSISLQELVMGNKVVCGLHLGTLLSSSPEVVTEAVQYMFHLCSKGIIKPRIHAVFLFDQVAEAIKTLADRRNVGKVLIRVK